MSVGSVFRSVQLVSFYMLTQLWRLVSLFAQVAILLTTILKPVFWDVRTFRELLTHLATMPIRHVWLAVQLAGMLRIVRGNVFKIVRKMSMPIRYCWDAYWNATSLNLNMLTTPLTCAFPSVLLDQICSITTERGLFVYCIVHQDYGLVTIIGVAFHSVQVLQPIGRIIALVGVWHNVHSVSSPILKIFRELAH